MDVAISVTLSIFTLAVIFLAVATIIVVAGIASVGAIVLAVTIIKEVIEGLKRDGRIS